MIHVFQAWNEKCTNHVQTMIAVSRLRYKQHDMF